MNPMLRTTYTSMVIAGTALQGLREFLALWLARLRSRG